MKKIVACGLLGAWCALGCIVPSADAADSNKPAAARSLPAGVTSLASFPAGTFLENIEITAAGEIYFTNYFEQAIYRRTPQGKVAQFAKLPIHPASVLTLDSGFVVAGHKVPFTKGPEFTGSNHLLLLNADGSVKSEVPVPQARFLNGMARLSPQAVLIADSIAGVIWHFDRASGAVTEWFRHEWLTQDPAVKEFRPGANGIKVADGWVYVSNSSRGAIYRARIDGGRVADNSMALFASTGSVDDFVVLAGGRVIAASHAEHLMDIDAGGKVRNLFAEGCGACTAVGVRPGIRNPAEVYVLTTGHALEGGKDPARLLRVDLTARAKR